MNKNKKNKILLITGKPRCGKSTLIKKIIDTLKIKKKKIGGIVTPELLQNNQRIGFKIIDLASGTEDVLSSVNIKNKNAPRVSKYGVNVAGIDKIIDIFLRSFDKADYIFIDEIGKMEFFSDKFKKMLDKVFSSNKTVIAALHRNYVNQFKGKGEIIYLERENFDAVFDEILEMLD